ncbi:MULTISPECIES: helix-turn-helix domain-containing protein [Streptomyces]|uniref:Helix-turn-helix domain-containing protein n=1 Tax=Streptomyces lasalocidi TaxID=324833 RepID=A0A4U5W4R0_STRLS|nr:XRE family transcriptional regulator [Streptomyces lasalocidi]TKS96436.1 helix-turn-helix domain-containing protein [Streptomyces lasalocidi]
MSGSNELTQCLARNVKHWRTQRNLTIDALAARARVSRGMIIQVEQARTNPSIGTVVKLSEALGVGLTVLLNTTQRPLVRIVPSEQAVQLWQSTVGSYSRLLAGVQAPGLLEMWSWWLMPGDSSPSGLQPAGATSLIHVISGDLTLTVDGTLFQVPAGASAFLAANAPHTYSNDGDIPTSLVIAISVHE